MKKEEMKKEQEQLPVITWEQKTHFIRLANGGKQDELCEYVKPLLNKMDLQGISMLIASVTITLDNIHRNIDFFGAMVIAVNKYLKKNKKHTLSMREALRYEVILSMVKRAKEKQNTEE
jgi:hypothetical protein